MDSATPAADSVDFLSGGGEMGALMRALDWTPTAVGPPQRWPQGLRTAIRLVLNTRHPMYIFWGPQGLCFYNDAYRASIGPERHPGSLAQPARAVWDEIWALIGPQIEQVMGGRGATWHENQLVPITRNGRREEVYWTYSYGPIDDPTSPNGVGGVLVVCTETTATVLAEQRREQELARQRHLFDQAPGFIIVMRGPRHTVEFVNEVHRKLFGSEGWVGRELREAFPDIAAQGFFELLDGVYTSGETYRAHSAPARFTQPDGLHETRLLDFVYSPIVGLDGKVEGVFCEGIDVTERVRDQAAIRETGDALRRRDEQLRLATEAAEVGLWDVDPLRGELFWPPIVKAMFGIPESLPVSMDDFYGGLHPDDRERVSTAYAMAADPARRTVYDVEYRTIGKEDGVLRWVAAKGRALFDADGTCIRLIGTAIDISERKFDEERLRRSEARLAEAVATLDGLLASAPIAFAFFDRRLAYVRVNAVLAAINQASVEAHHGETVENLSGVDARLLTPLLRQVMASGQTVSAVEVDASPFDSGHGGRAFLAGFFPVHGPAGDVQYVGMTLVDITQRRWAETALKRVNDNLEAQVAERTAERDRVWRHSRDLLVVANADGFLLAVSPSWTSILGHVPEQVVGRHVDAFVWTEDTTATRRAWASAHADTATPFEGRFRHLDGTPRWVSWRTSVEQGIVYAYGRDVTTEKAREADLERTQEALRQAQKMEAIGQLTGGIAHDFNNLLQSLSGNLELIKRRPRDPERVLKWAELGMFAVSRGAKLTSQLLAFSRSQKLQLEPLDIAVLLPRMHELLSRALGPAIVVRIHAAEPSIVAVGDETQLEMAVLNLAINARDAMPEGGSLHISVQRKRMAAEPPLPAGDYAEVRVEDSGSGMPPDVAARAFDPFFTTKGVGKGTGLGLSQVYGMTHQAGGAARIESREGSGTAVYLYLPCTDKAVDPTEATVDGDVGHPERQALVLVIDDDDDVRRLLLDSLEALGYRTAEAADGPAGIEAHGRLGPDAVIVDFAMPGMSGAEVATAMRAVQPGLPIVFASGFSETAAIERVAGAHAPTLRKPFGIDELGRTLATVMASRSGNAARA